MKETTKIILLILLLILLSLIVVKMAYAFELKVGEPITVGLRNETDGTVFATDTCLLNITDSGGASLITDASMAHQGISPGTYSFTLNATTPENNTDWYQGVVRCTTFGISWSRFYVVGEREQELAVKFSTNTNITALLTGQQGISQGITDNTSGLSTSSDLATRTQALSEGMDNNRTSIDFSSLSNLTSSDINISLNDKIQALSQGLDDNRTSLQIDINVSTSTETSIANETRQQILQLQLDTNTTLSWDNSTIGFLQDYMNDNTTTGFFYKLLIEPFSWLGSGVFDYVATQQNVTDTNTTISGGDIWSSVTRTLTSFGFNVGLIDNAVNASTADNNLFATSLDVNVTNALANETRIQIIQLELDTNTTLEWDNNTLSFLQTYLTDNSTTGMFYELLLKPFFWLDSGKAMFEYFATQTNATSGTGATLAQVDELVNISRGVENDTRQQIISIVDGLNITATVNETSIAETIIKDVYLANVTRTYSYTANINLLNVITDYDDLGYQLNETFVYNDTANYWQLNSTEIRRIK